MSLSRIIPALCLLLATAAFAGCASGEDVAYGFGAEEAVGVWEIDDARGTATITLRSDGTFEALDWPQNLRCADESAKDSKRVSWDRLVTLSGTWRTGDPDNPQLSLFVSSGNCTESPSGSIVIDDQGRYKLQIFLAPIDTATRDEIILFTER